MRSWGAVAAVLVGTGCFNDATVTPMSSSATESSSGSTVSTTVPDTATTSSLPTSTTGASSSTTSSASTGVDTESSTDATGATTGGEMGVGASGAVRFAYGEDVMVYDAAAAPNAGLFVVGTIGRVVMSELNREAFLLRVNSDGGAQWGRWTQWPDNEQFFAVTSVDDRVIAVGMRRASGDSDILVSEFQPDGTYVSSTTIGTAGQDEEGWAIAPTTTGGFAIAGNTSTASDGRDGLVVLLDAALTPVAAMSLGGSFDDALRDIEEAGAGSYAVSGFFGQDNSDRSSLVATVSPMGATVDVAFVFGSGANDQALSVAPLGNGRYLFSGETSGWGAGSNDGLIGVVSPAAGQEVQAWTLGGTGYDTLMELIELDDDRYAVVGLDESSGDGPDVWMAELEVSRTPQLVWQYIHRQPRFQFVRGGTGALRTDGGLAVAFQDNADGADLNAEPGVLFTTNLGQTDSPCPDEVSDPYELQPVGPITADGMVGGQMVTLQSGAIATMSFDALNLTAALNLCQ